ncbi:PQQ-binding-like beta-propeller repeat protein [Streptomyces sp. ISL-96]|uniref:protein kinase domain-containing protein n=1 Tax=Streptomyces sp. ISL-96 TaxID=2819191 RepID=UPI001BE73E72|nr:PQQ-binding-like beta-propeller repeat protein [Streptomyces sp. ISL-96]MBT2490915.1 PQQ-binding-like beta-propeller repeat protein [Streptomyces sp. ISL-96]
MDPLGTGDPLRLGPYRLHGVLGEGGMGKVYFGQDRAGATAAVKVLRPELAHDQNLAQRFVREAHMAQAVTSTGVARVLVAQTEGGRPWMATEFLTGPTLDQAVDAHGPFDETAVRALATALARTLVDIHAAGLVHRDLKPANIVLTSVGPRIIDFGIARPEHGLTLTTTGQVPVTPGYGAPEQALGRRVGPPADVFSLGAVLVYAASGCPAFDGGHVAAVQYEVVHGEPQLGRIPARLEPLIAPCLAKDPAFRPTPGQMATAFAPPRGADRVWRHGPVATDIKQRERTVHQLTTAVSGTGTARRMSRRRLLTTLAVGGTAVVAGGGSAAWWLRERQRPDAFALPPAAKIPEAQVLSAAGGKATPLWGPLAVLSKESPIFRPVRDVIVLGAKNGGITAHSVVDGKLRWTAPEADAAAGILSLSDALVAAVDAKGALMTFVASTGDPRWTAPAAGARTVIAADDTAVYVATKDGRLRSISRSDGTTRWTAHAKVDLEKERRPIGIAAQGRLVVTTDSGAVIAVDSGNGRHVWDIPNQATADEEKLRPVVSGRTVYINGTTLTARSIADGTEQWAKTEVSGGKTQPAGPPVVRGKTVYATAGPHVMGYSADDGTELWKSAEGYFIHSPVAFQGNDVCVINTIRSSSDDMGVWAMAHDSRRRSWTYPLPADAGSYGMAGSGNRVFVTHGDALLALPVSAQGS